MGTKHDVGRFLATAAAVCVCFCAPGEARASEGDAVRASAAALFDEDPSSEKWLPGEPPRPEPRRASPAIRRPDPGARDPGTAPVPPALGAGGGGAPGAASEIGWVLVALAGALTAYWAFRAAFEARGGTFSLPVVAGTTALPATAQSGGAAPSTLARARELAADGRYTEAVHAVLLAALGELVSRGAAVPQSALTSREVVATARAGDPARQAALRLVRAVETTHFAGRAAGAADFEACVRAYEQLDSALGRGAA